MSTLSVAAVSAVIAISGCATADFEGDHAAEVRAVSEAYRAALQELDHDAIAAFWAEDATLMPSGGPDLAGGPAIRAMMSENYPLLRDVELDVVSSEIQVSGDFAFEVTSYEERLGAADGTDVQLSGRYLFVWRREASGAWKILRGMYNYTR